MSKFGTEFSPSDAPALPHWIGGHAYLTMAASFYDVRAADGRVLRRVPLSGEAEADVAVDNARDALAAWLALDAPARAQAFQAAHDLLVRYREHLAKVIAEESGIAGDLAAAELDQAIAALAGGGAADRATGGGVVAIIADASEALAAPLACVLDALRANHAVVVKPSVRVPSPLLAMAEVLTRAGFPDGLVNVLQGDEAAVRALCLHPRVDLLACVGDPAVGQVVAGHAQAAGKPLVAGRGEAALARWRGVLGLQA